MTTVTIEQTNDLRFTTSKIVGKKHITVKIRLNDECKNGHQDFSITGDIYEAGKPKTDRYYISGGCIHEDIAKHFPEFIPFIKLHLCDYKGIPMHCSANGFCHLKNGLGNTKPEDPKFTAEYCEYYRITPEQFNVLSQSYDQTYFAMNLERLGIFQQWEAEANQAIKQLEQLTGKAFLVDSKKTQYYPPTQEQREEAERRIKNGYYTPLAEAKRQEAAKVKELDKLEEDRQKEISKINLEYDVKKEVLKAGGKEALSNCIFYTHTQTLSFNWKSYERMPAEKINAIIRKMNLPKGVNVEVK